MGGAGIWTQDLRRGESQRSDYFSFILFPVLWTPWAKQKFLNLMHDEALKFVRNKFGHKGDLNVSVGAENRKCLTNGGF